MKAITKLLITSLFIVSPLANAVDKGAKADPAKATTNATAKKSVSNSQLAKAKNRVNVNSASAKQLATALTGIGKKKAEAIVQYRSANGKFKNINDLSKVKGIGAELIAKNLDRITL